MVIGFDARHNSDVFARDTAEIMTGAGFKALVMPRTLPTPLLAFAIRELGCAAGVMVTASHNPPQDNGYKVYLGDGSQIVPPADSEIAARIAAVGPLAELPRGDAGRLVGEEIVDRYLDTVAGLAEDGPRDLRDRLHPAARRRRHDRRAGAWRPPGSTPRTSSSSRSTPTPTSRPSRSPTRRSPARWTWRWRSPPSTRPTWWSPTTPTPTAAPSPVRRTSTAGGCCAATRWAPCSAHHLLAPGRQGTYANSIVSSSLLGKMAAAAGQPHEETLTGFKWIGRVEGLAFGYEEALGYCCDPEHVRDKDGVSALLLVCELAAQAKAEGRGLTDLLDDIAREHGLHATDQLSVRFDDLAAIPATMDRLRERPPTTLGGLAVEQVEDLSRGRPRCRRPTGCATPSPRVPASSCVPAAPSPRSSATSRS